MINIFNELTSSKGHPVDLSTVCDCSMSNFKSLSLISFNNDGLVLITEIRNVTTDVSSPKISPTVISGLSVTFSNGSGFQFFIKIVPEIRVYIIGLFVFFKVPT